MLYEFKYLEDEIVCIYLYFYGKCDLLVCDIKNIILVKYKCYFLKLIFFMYDLNRGFMLNLW